MTILNQNMDLEKLYPIVQLKDLWMQIPSLKKKYLKFENYKNYIQ